MKALAGLCHSASLHSTQTSHHFHGHLIAALGPKILN